VKKYSSADPFLLAFLRRTGIEVLDVYPDPNNPRRMRVSLNISEDSGRVLEIKYRNSDYRRYVAEYQDTVDLIKRR